MTQVNPTLAVFWSDALCTAVAIFFHQYVDGGFGHCVKGGWNGSFDFYRSCPHSRTSKTYWVKRKFVFNKVCFQVVERGWINQYHVFSWIPRVRTILSCFPFISTYRQNHQNHKSSWKNFLKLSLGSDWIWGSKFQALRPRSKTIPGWKFDLYIYIIVIVCHSICIYIYMYVQYCSHSIIWSFSIRGIEFVWQVATLKKRNVCFCLGFVPARMMIPRDETRHQGGWWSFQNVFSWCGGFLKWGYPEFIHL